MPPSLGRDQVALPLGKVSRSTHYEVDTLTTRPCTIQNDNRSGNPISQKQCSYWSLVNNCITKVVPHNLFMSVSGLDRA